ncbi:MAG TPA: lipocalin family protein [Gemmataceae bacterium]|jgi:uncharacterized protein (TIGR03066 family)|nr:lipocalin family protein [Gemmataceae bacterium]
MKNFMAAFAVVVFLGAATAQDKKDEAKKEAAKVDAAKLVGTWEITKSTGDAPKGSLVSFDKDGKLKVSIDFNGKKIEIEGTYKVEGDKLTVTVKSPPDGKDETDTNTIKLLDDKTLVIVDMEKKETELARKAGGGKK